MEGSSDSGPVESYMYIYMSSYKMYEHIQVYTHMLNASKVVKGWKLGRATQYNVHLYTYMYRYMYIVRGSHYGVTTATYSYLVHSLPHIHVALSCF